MAIDVKNCHLPCLRGQANQPAHLAGLPGGGSSVLAQALASPRGAPGKRGENAGNNGNHGKNQVFLVENWKKSWYTLW